MKIRIHKKFVFLAAIFCFCAVFSSIAIAKPPELKKNSKPSFGNQQKNNATDEGVFNKKIKGASPAEAIKLIKDYAGQSGRDLDKTSKKVHDAKIGKPISRKKNIINIPGRNFAPDKGVHQKLREKVKRIKTSKDKNKEIISIIQFEEDVPLNKVVEMYELGFTYFDGIGDSAIIAKIPLGAIEKLEKLPFIRWIGEYKDEYKYNPSPSKSGKKGSYIT